MAQKKVVSSCDICLNYEYDEEYDCYVCSVNLDEDDYGRFLSQEHFSCPYFVMGDEYKIVHKQI